MNEVEKLKKLLKSKKKKKVVSNKASDFLSTGCTLINLSLTGRINRGYMKGKCFTVVGKSESGKTFLTLTCLAEAAMDKNFDDYALILDDVEGGALMNMERYFGKAMASRIKAPGTYEDGSPRNSRTIEEFYYNVDDAVKAGIPFIYLVDSMDCLSSNDEENIHKKRRIAHDKGVEGPGTYGDGKAKINSASLRSAINSLEKTGSILIIIIQSKANFDFGPETESTAGGNALKYYPTASVWSSVEKTITKQVRGKKRQQGAISKIRVKKNRFTGQKHAIRMVFYHSHGIDDVESNIEYLLEEGHWKKSGSNINATDFEFKGDRSKLIAHIEENGLERKLQSIVGHVWNDIVEQSAVKRKRRYE